MSNTQKPNFQLQPVAIDYFKLEADHFKPHCNVSKEVITLSKNDKYIKYPIHFNSLDLNKKETVVFNFPVGKGKTTICYNLIEQYSNNGYCVIVCSPFSKLVDKDFAELQKRICPPVTTGMITGRTLEVCRYTDLMVNNPHFPDGPTRAEILAEVPNVHIMTINCFLGNPGDNAFEQSFVKRDYLQKIIEATKNRKVILFIDELHESIHNFEPSFIANLLRWKGIVQKAYIASATFTPATIPAVKAISMLTDGNVHIYESDRKKNTAQANIHLHTTPYPINGYGQQFFSVLNKEITRCRTAGKCISILTGTKSLAEKIADTSFKHVIKSESGIKKHKQNDSIYLLTSDTELEYQKDKNNIGTTFKTGVDITNPDAVLFIIVPTITNSLNSQHYGIFTDGIPAIVQSVGRLREGGDIHIFISEPDLLIDPNNTKYPNELSDKKSCIHHLQNVGYPILQKEYENKVANLSSEISDMEANISNSKYSSLLMNERENEFIMWYPNFHEFLMDKSQRILVKEHPSFGKYLSPYIFWACLRDQFQNATLKEIIHHQPPIKKINVPKVGRASLITDLLLPLNNTIKQHSFREFAENFPNQLKQSENNDGDICQHEYVFAGKSIFSNRLMKEQSGFSREILEEVIFIKTGNRHSLLKREYVTACLSDIHQGSVYHEIKIREAYRQLLELRDKYLRWYKTHVICESEQNYIPSKLYSLLPNDIFHEAHKVFSLIKKHDPLIGNKVFSVLQNLTDEETDQNKKKICTELDELFILRSTTRKMIDGINYYELPSDYVQELENCYSITLL